MAVESRKWTVEVEFDELDLQAARNPEYVSPNDECSRVIGSLIDAWAIPPEDLKEFAEWTTSRLALQLDFFDEVEYVVRALWGYSMPKSVTVTRND